jgi:hypothetical protein
MKCTGIMGLIFGHKWSMHVTQEFYRQFNEDTLTHDVRCKYHLLEKCQRCGAVTGEKK